MLVRTRLPEIRRMRGISAAELARRVGVSRQSIYAIEDGSFVPNTAVSLQLSRALDVTVEALFSIAEDEAESDLMEAHLLAGDQVKEGQLARVCRVDDRLMAIPTAFLPAYLPIADGIIESQTKSAVSVRSASHLPQDGKRLLLAGCDPALSVLNHALRSSEIEIISVPCSSRCALQWLKGGTVHAAGSHLRDRTTGDYNLPIIKRLLPSASIRVVTFAVWEQGMVLGRGNPKGLHTVADLAAKDVTIINREKGAGSRDLLDAGLRRFGIAPQQVSGYDSVAQGHLAAAYAVAAGIADCCIAPRSAARCFGLDFVPLAVERFDLTFVESSLNLPATKALLDLLNTSNLRRKLQSIAGYDTAHTGDVLV